MVDLSKFKDLYFLEAEDQLEVLNRDILVLENDINKGENNDKTKERINTLMRASHTLKGSSATMGYNGVAFLAHVMEDVFDAARNDELVLNSEIITAVFAALDAMEAALEAIKNNGAEGDLTAYSNNLKKITGINTVGVGKSQKGKKKEAEKSEAVEVDPEIDVAVAAEDKDLKSEKSSMLTESDKDGITVIKKIDYIKVPIERLDNLMDLIEELVIDRMRLKQLSINVPELKEVSEHINLLTQSIQYEVMQSRLVPVGQIFGRFPRMIRDLASKQGKEIDFLVSGEDLELDRSVVDKLGEPLVHLLRNAVDHGVRKSGTIRLAAKREREFAIITVENDDQCIDLKKVKEAAVKRGLMTEKEISFLNDAQILNLIFHPRGLSTNDQVTEISGRGVGLGVVKSFVDSLGGRVSVENMAAGVRFQMELPLTLAIIESLLVDISGRNYAIPFSVVERSVLIHAKDIKQIGDKYFGVVDGLNIPLVDMSSTFRQYDLSSLSMSNEATNVSGAERIAKGGNVLVVIIRKEDEYAGLIIDRLVGEQEITVKPLSPVLRGLKGFSGSTILGDGKIILILDVINLIKEKNYA